MKRHHLTLVFLFAATLAVTSACQGGWNLPDPEDMAHPGAQKAPASSPTTYADENGFQKRASLVIQGLGDEDLSKWRRGWFARGGDPAKYLIGAAMARLLADPNDAQARKYMNDDRTPREHYHFGTVNWARFYPLFGEKVLTEETKEEFANRGFRYGSYRSPRGTENHKVMWWTSANVLPYYTGKGLTHRSVEATLKHAKGQLRDYVKGLYKAGQGEWDSSTYLMFDVNGMLNIYDFSQDDEARLLAKAALDWYLAGYALKYTDGVYCAPNQRGFAPGPVKKIADQTGYLWWGSHRDVKPEDMANARYTLHAITSGYRPNKVISNIARKSLPKLPVEFRNTKPNYWHGLGRKPTPGQYHESVYLSEHYTMASLWNGWGGQMTRFQLVASSDDGGIVFTGGHPTGYKYHDGGGKYDQALQVGSVHVLMSRIPKDDPLQYVFFSLPKEASKPKQEGGWWIITAGKTYLAMHPLTDNVEVGEADLSEKQQQANAKRKEEGKSPKYPREPMLKLAGPNTGWVLVTGDASQFESLRAFQASLDRVEIDDSDWRKEGVLTLSTPDGRKVRAGYRPGNESAKVAIDGEKVDYGNWDAIYNGPYIHHDNQILKVNDGKDGFTVDFTGDLPVYKTWKK